MRVFLDTNVFILGVVIPESPEAEILSRLGFQGNVEPTLDAKIIVCKALLDQIRRVGRRVGGKDFAGALISQVWQNLSVEFISIDDEEIAEVLHQGRIPREDIEIYLGARNGNVDYFVSGNHELVKAMGAEESLFASFDAQTFCDQILK